jgi:hypothetical protein
MTCSEIQADLSLYLYGELEFAAEELIEVHLNECAFCQMALNREKEWHAALNRQQRDVRPEWLAECRKELWQQIADEPTTMAHARHRFAEWARTFFDVRFTSRSYRVAGVSFLLMVGFAAGRLFNGVAQRGIQGDLDAAGLVQPTVTRVQQISAAPDNRVRIVLQQMQVREITGSRNDDEVRQLLVGAAHESLDPGVRMDSVDMLAGQGGSEIRDALVSAIRNDPNAAVRVKAIDSLRKFPGDSVTREALEYALAHDADAGVRTEAMDVLIPSQGNLQVTPQLIEIMSNVMHSPETDEYVRWRCQQILNHQSSSNDVY